MPFYALSPSGGLIEAATFAALPATGAANTLYVVTSTNTLYRWAGASYVEVSPSLKEIIYATDLAAFPATGDISTIYVASDTRKAYRWNGSAYVEISPSEVTSVAGRTGAVTLTKSDVGLSNVDDTSDSGKPISSATQTALNLKASLSGATFTGSVVAPAFVGDLSGTAANASNVSFSGVQGKPTTLAGYGITDAAASTHSHGNLTNAGAIGSTSGLPIVTGTGGVLQAGAFGTAAGTVCQGNDSRLSNARSPTTHGGSHAFGASDQIFNQDLNTTGDVSFTTVTVTDGGSLHIFGDGITFADNTNQQTAWTGAIGSTSGLPIVTGANGVLQAGSFGTAAGTVCQGNDSRVATAAPLPTAGLSITKSGDWTSTSPVRFVTAIPPCGIGIGDSNYTRFDGKWITSGWSYTESNYANTGGARLTALTFNDLQGVIGTFSITTTGALTTVGLPELAFADIFTITSHTALTSVSLPKLIATRGNFFIQSSALTSYTAPSFVFCGGSLTVSGGSATTSVSFPVVEFIGSNFQVDSMDNVTSIAAPALKRIMGGLFHSVMNGVVSLSYPALEYMGSLNMTGMNALTTISLPALKDCGTITLSALTALANFTLPTNGTLRSANNVAASGIALTTASVDNILAALASLDGTNGTVSYGSPRTVNLSGGTSAAPTDLGSTTTAGSNFVCSGTTCTVNWTGHGYATGDVLRVSGITTATNANRYARITVVNANQFTYTITSQTATGAGTATVRKAAASANALVTRGVTLTTN